MVVVVVDVGGELRLIVAINSNWGTATVEWFSFTAVMYRCYAVVSNTSLAVQSDIKPLNPIMSPKKIVTQSKCSANAVISPPYKQTHNYHWQKFLQEATRLLEFVSLSVFDHISVSLTTLTLLLFMSLTIDVGRKSWKAFSVFIFSASNSLTFSITSLAKTWLFEAV